METKERNREFQVLSAIAMICVVAGHVDYGILNVGDLFPYYSFHIGLFLFISGYFYRTEEKEQIGAYLWRKGKRLLLPYFVWNLVYGIVAALLHRAGFAMGQELNLRTLLWEPFLNGHQFLYNSPAWFVPALFLVETLNVCGRKLASMLKLEKEWLILAVTLLIGGFVIVCAAGGHVYGWYVLPGRILFLLPCFEMGQFYKQKLEARDRLPDGLYFTVLLVIQFAVAVTCQGLGFSAVWCGGFLNGPVIPYLTIATGTAFWLRVSKRLAPVLGQSRGFLYFGSHTFAVMMHQGLALMAVKGVFALLAGTGRMFADFNREAFYTDLWYMYCPGGYTQIKLFYVLLGIVLPLLLGYGVERARAKLGEWYGRRRPVLERTE